MQIVESSDNWKAAWQPVIDQVGQQLSNEPISWGADEVEAGAIRRILEPLEFDCGLHSDREMARANGFSDVVAPCASLMMFSRPPVWVPGESQFSDQARNAQPGRLSTQPRLPAGAPPVTGFFLTDWGAEYLRPVVAGERLGRRGQLLVACSPKETKVGRGAFLTFESEIVDRDGEPVAKIRHTAFVYNPHPGSNS